MEDVPMAAYAVFIREATRDQAELDVYTPKAVAAMAGHPMTVVTAYSRSAIITATLLATMAAAAAAQEAVPQVRKQAPGYYRMMLGDFEVTAVCDGTAPQEFDRLMTNTTPEEVRALVARSHEALPLEVSINTFLINTGSKLVLVDTGAGSLYGPKSGGRLVANLEAAGYRPDQIDAVLLTHIHGDHSAGLTVGGKVVFPKAAVYVNERERDYWLDASQPAKAPPEKKASFAQAHQAIDPYIKAGRLRTFDGETELFPGVRTVPAPGHTPGHTLYYVESRGQKLVLIGDTVHAAEAQFPQPSMTIRYDVDPGGAAAQRKKIFADAAAKGYWVGAAHVSFPGLGHLRVDGEGYAWVPATYRVID
jgi:glyoxylase-like metal-dependent hydrolase (beta-lactamase superfamily II)